MRRETEKDESQISLLQRERVANKPESVNRESNLRCSFMSNAEHQKRNNKVYNPSSSEGAGDGSSLLRKTGEITLLFCFTKSPKAEAFWFFTAENRVCSCSLV